MPSIDRHRFCLFFRWCLLHSLCAIGLISCHSNPPGDSILVSSTTQSELKIGQPLSIGIEAGFQPLVVEILSQDANYRSKIIAAGQQELSEIQLAFLRSAPVYHFIAASAQSAHYTLQITPLQVTRRASVTVNVYALPAASTADAALAMAWSNLARGLQFVNSEAAADWAENLEALTAARQQFEHLGLREQALWAQYFKAYFEYYPLYRYAESLAAASALIEKSRELHVPVLTLLSHQLAGQIRLERDAGNDEAQARRNYSEALDNFNKARRLAQDLHNGFEGIWAINNAGIAFNYQDRLDLALERYDEALDMALDLQDTYLTTLIGTNRAVAQQRLGHIDLAIETLRHVQQELTVQDDPLEMENVQGCIGHLLPQAVPISTGFGGLEHSIGIVDPAG